MTISSLPKGKHGNNNGTSQDDDIEGTSARTRPCSFTDIMLRRKNKADAINKVADGSGGADIASGRDNLEKKIHPKEPHKKINEDYRRMDTKHASNDSQKGSYRLKSTICAPSTYNNSVQDKDKEFRDPGYKSRGTNVINNRVVGGRSERHYQSNRRNDGLSIRDTENRYDTQKSRDRVQKDRVSIRSRAEPEKDRKRQEYEERGVHRKRKTDEQMSSNARNESKKRNTSDMARRERVSHQEMKPKRFDAEENKDTGRTTGKKNYSEIKGPDLTRSHLEESKPSKRRSRSREREKNRSRRSPSRSPKANKQTFIDKKDHAELSSHSTKDRSRTQNTDVDRNNESSNRYRDKDDFSSGLGGYSPRKRKTEAAAKTPSPIRHSPDKIVEKETKLADSNNSNLNMSAQNLLLNVKELPVVAPVAPTIGKPLSIPHITLPSQMHAVEAIQLTQATRPMRRLYVENLPSASEKELMECINSFLMSSGVNCIKGTKPCISCIINKEKCQALLEFLTPEDASAALALDVISFAGSDLKLRRPKDYTEGTTDLSDKSVVAVNSISDVVEDSPNKIFIGGISKVISSGMFLEIARVFGPVKAYRFEYQADINESCAFLEYVDNSITSKACAGLNGMKLGGQIVTAVFAVADTVLMENVAKTPFYGIPEHAKPLLEESAAVIKLKNVLDPEGLLSISEIEIEELMQDIKLECSRFGTVKSLNIVKPTDPSSTLEAFEGKKTNVSTDCCDLEFDDKSDTTKQLLEGITNSEKLDTTELQETLNLSEKNSQSVEGDKGCDDIDEMSEPTSDDGNISLKDPSINSFPNINVENEAVIKEESELDENNAKIEADVELNGDDRKEYNASKERIDDDSTIDLGVLFEPGSIFVEFRRAESACTAAHCLHGRLYDGRVVGVAYVDLELYQMKFCR